MASNTWEQEIEPYSERIAVLHLITEELKEELKKFPGLLSFHPTAAGSVRHRMLIHVAERTGFELRHTEATALKAGAFDWTSPAKRALVVGTDRQSDLCSEHAQRPASVPGLWWCKRPIVGIGSGGQGWKSPVTDLAGAVAASPVPMRIARRRGHLTRWTTRASMNSAANGDGFITASHHGSVAICCCGGSATASRKSNMVGSANRRGAS